MWMYNKVKDWHERVRFGFLQYPEKNTDNANQGLSKRGKKEIKD